MAVSIWRLNMGLPKDGGSSEELAIAAQFIAKNFNHLTLGELELACNLFVMGKLDSDIKFYGTLSPLFIGSLLNGYMFHRKLALADLIRKKEKAEEQETEKNNRPTPEQQSENTKRTIEEFYNEYKSTGELRDILSICYRFFRKHKEIFNFYLTKEQIQTATKWAEQKVKEDMNKSGLFKIKSEDQKLQTDRYGRIWCVQNYFDNVNIVDILNNIKPNLFQ